MHKSRRIAVGVAIASSIVALSGFPAIAQTPAPSFKCNPMSDLRLAKPPEPKPATPVTLTRIDDTTKSAILNSGLPCQEIVNPVEPEDHIGPAKTALENRQRGFDFYSWLTFIALNSPADRGITIDKSAPDTPTTWEDMKDFRQLSDVMLPPNMMPPVPNPNDPKPLEDENEKVRLMPPACQAQYTRGSGTMVIKMVEETFNEPFKTGPLIDQSGHYALFDILMNKAMYKYIYDHQLYSQAGQRDQAKSNLSIDFPEGHNLPAPGMPGSDPGAIMIKVSWKILNPDEVNSKKFHMVNALVSLPKSANSDVEPPCLPETLGLVGFHVVHKTISRPQWIWTSFEHVDNVPEQREVDAGPLPHTYSFYDRSCNASKCPVNETPPRPWDPDPDSQLKFHGSFNSQITRVTPLTPETVSMNEAFQGLLKGTVWQNYMLISTQWPSGFPCAILQATVSPPNSPVPQTDFLKQPDMTCAPAPAILANSTLETYSQGDIPLASSSCMACHGNAVSFQTRPANAKPGDIYFNQSDFTFMLEKAQ
jgi:hypothetical protein